MDERTNERIRDGRCRRSVCTECVDGGGCDWYNISNYLGSMPTDGK